MRPVGAASVKFVGPSSGCSVKCIASFSLGGRFWGTGYSITNRTAPYVTCNAGN